MRFGEIRLPDDLQEYDRIMPLSPINFDRKTISLTADFIEAAMEDASVLEGIPQGAVLVLLPADDPEFVEESISLGVDAVRKGRDVVFRHFGKVAPRATPT
jgi:hypothetical protein